MSLLNRSIREVVAIPEVKQRYADLGIEARASAPEDVKARLEADIKKWSALIERAGIQKL
jgi:tripartite-type tricarboxylate transporter receptor subunit TctC